jgi:hypothetical protein
MERAFLFGRMGPIFDRVRNYARIKVQQHQKERVTVSSKARV